MADNVFQQLTAPPRSRVFIRIVDPENRVIDFAGTCSSVEIDTNFSRSMHLGPRPGQYIGREPLGVINFHGLEALSFMIAEAGASLDRFLHDDSLPKPEDIYPLQQTPWWMIQGLGFAGDPVDRYLQDA